MKGKNNRREKINFIENDFELMLKLAELFRNKKSL
jgi:hypothetical protein